MANTTNLNLAKPAGTDKALVSVLNSNSDKIDAWAGTTNQALSKVDTAHNFGQYTSLDTFKNDLLTFMQNVATFKTVAIQFVFTQTVAPFGAWNTFSGYAHCIQNGSTSLYFSCDVASNNGEDVSIGYSNGTWNINKLALNSDVDRLFTNTSARYIKHFMFQNTSSIVIDLQHEQTNQYFSMLEVVNANQGVLSHLEGSTKRNYGGKNVSLALSGSTATITADDGGTLWGITHVTLTTNYQLT